MKTKKKINYISAFIILELKHYFNEYVCTKDWQQEVHPHFCKLASFVICKLMHRAGISSQKVHRAVKSLKTPAPGIPGVSGMNCFKNPSKILENSHHDCRQKSQKHFSGNFKRKSQRNLKRISSRNHRRKF